MKSNCYQGAIIIPVLNEAATIEATLIALQPLKSDWLIVVVDGGSQDQTVSLAKDLAGHCLVADRGRAAQQNAGAWYAKPLLAQDAVLLFLHGDTFLPASFSSAMAAFKASGCQWGRFDVRLSGAHWLLQWVGFMMNYRSRITGIATGDQGLFFRHSCFWQLGAFPYQPLMEDIEITKRAKRLSKPYCVKHRVVTSSRKWEREGILKTIVLMWCCRAAYFFGVKAETIHRWYYR